MTAFFEWEITEDLPGRLTGGSGGGGGLFKVDTTDFDVALGDLPFMLYSGAEEPYERATAQWQRDQFDADRNVGEHSLMGWWLRSQSTFAGGTGITYFEPLMGEGSETRFRDSRGVDVFTDPTEARLLADTEQVAPFTSNVLEAESGPNRMLVRDGANVRVWDGTTMTNVTGTVTAHGLAYTGSMFLVGDTTGIFKLDEAAGTALTSLWTGATASVKVFWCKQRVFAGVGPALYELTLAGGDLTTETPLYTHPDPGWTWVAGVETGGAAWIAGKSGDRSGINVITIADDGTTPTLTGGVVGVQLPHGEIVNALLGYLDFLIVATNRGVRIAISQDERAALGPLIFRDEAVLSLAARGDYVYCGLANGLTRRIDLSNEVAGDLGFAYANDLEIDGDVAALAFFGETQYLLGGGAGLYRPTAELVSTGYLTTGFVRYGTMENKQFQDVLVTVDLTQGSLGISAGVNDPLIPVTTLANLNGARTVSLNVPGENTHRLSLQFRFNRDDGDPTLGPVMSSYQLRAMPAPGRRQRLIRLPLQCFDFERDRWGNTVGGPLFAFTRLRELETVEGSSAVMTLQDFRTGEARTVVVDQVTFSAPVAPDRANENFGGTLSLTVRAID